ncbi:rhodanese-like domain-containing protein [Pelomonas sp. APW6]|uniref:Rhodanese-like domain-containing protein n=1 Tax=Roseateles subflavus TaxID=3053353 RepID=A0ABT7LPI6_9BURK|nr:rhodanese-like domain-containing protein [Pelomonas sp. APW6]MDL5034075.1 rhodanese-like domain-containing protein [Pelomonas sp. APW6]
MTLSLPLLHLDPRAALQAIREGAWLVDVREGHEVTRLGYGVERLLLMPLSDFERRHTELPADADLILACAAGGRSQQAMNYLRHLGHRRVRNLTGGMAAWLAHGLPVRGGG